MAHSLGSPGEFDPSWKPGETPEPENPDARPRDINEEIAAQNEEVAEPTADDLETWPVTGEDDEEHSEDERLTALQSLILGAAGDVAGREPEYVLFPEHLALFVHHDIIEKDEARDYLKSRGINLR